MSSASRLVSVVGSRGQTLHRTSCDRVSFVLATRPMPAFTTFDQRGYRSVPTREGYGQWAATYERTVKTDMDLWLLDAITSVAWNRVERAADLGCGTGRTG